LTERGASANHLADTRGKSPVEQGVRLHTLIDIPVGRDVLLGQTFFLSAQPCGDQGTPSEPETGRRRTQRPAASTSMARAQRRDKQKEAS